MNNCMFTEHRPQSLPFRFNENDFRCINLKRHLADLIRSKIICEGVTNFLSGMALGVDCMQKRNRYMVDHSDCAIAVWNGTNSGTGKTVQYALSKNLKITVLDLFTYSIRDI